MKKTAIFAVCATAFAGAANAGFQTSKLALPLDGIVNEETIITVKQAGEMRDDTDVILQGKIVAQFKGDKYTFQDDTGSMIVEIDDDAWRDQTVTPDDVVKIYGEVDRGIFSTEVDVDRVEKQ